MNVTVSTLASPNYYWATSENVQSTWYGSLQFGFFTQNFTAGSAVGTSGTMLAGAWTLKGESVGAMKCWGTSTTGSVTFEILLGFSIYDWTTAAYLTAISPTSVVLSERVNLWGELGRDGLGRSQYQCSYDRLEECDLDGFGHCDRLDVF